MPSPSRPSPVRTQKQCPAGMFHHKQLAAPTRGSKTCHRRPRQETTIRKPDHGEEAFAPDGAVPLHGSPPGAAGESLQGFALVCVATSAVVPSACDQKQPLSGAVYDRRETHPQRR